MVHHHNPAAGKPARVVVIGARGFIGAALCRQLGAQGIPLLPLMSADLDLTAPVATEKLAAMIKADDAAIMLAALTPDKGRDIATLMKNLAMMQHLCNALEKTGCAHLVYFSSDAVYAPDVSRVTEETPPSPRDLYGVMHYARELMANSLTKTPVLVLRPTLVYGVDDTHNAYGPNQFRRAAQKDGKITLFGEGEETRDHIHVDDVAMLTVHCLMRRSAGTLNVATGVSKPFREVAELVAAQFPGKISVISSPRQNPVTHRHYDMTNLIRAFPGYRFVQLDEGIGRVHRELAGRR